MIDHTGYNVSDPEKSRRFYDAVFAAIGGKLLVTVPPEFTGGKEVHGYGTGGRAYFWIAQGEPNTPRMHVAFAVDSHAQVDAFHAAGIAAGGTDNGPPGPRPHYSPDYYGAFVRDPDGHNVECVTRASRKA